MRYRADIDGLRAVAVLPVVLFHAGVSAFPSGYVGVDVFFVISGYLITSIIVSEIDSKSFSLANSSCISRTRCCHHILLSSRVCASYAQRLSESWREHSRDCIFRIKRFLRLKEQLAKRPGGSHFQHRSDM
jgi:hypothetical protein